MDSQWQFKEVDSSLFKAFVFAAHELNFTKAAQKAGMTQSGVSQKVSKLEAQIGQPLFLRVNKSVSLTDTGQTLLDYIERQQDELEKLFEQLKQEKRSLTGQVRYGMPHSCLFTPHFSLLLQDRQSQYGDVSIKVELCPNEEVVDKVMNRQIDFGFVTRKIENPAIEFNLFAVEEYAMVGHVSGSVLKATADFMRDLPFVNYPGMQNLFEIWKSGHFPASRRFNFESLVIAGEINSLHGAVTMLREGVGWSIMPTHVVAKELSAREMQIYPGTEKKKIKSEIYIITLKTVNQPARVRALLSSFEKMKKV